MSSNNLPEMVVYMPLVWRPLLQYLSPVCLRFPFSECIGGCQLEEAGGMLLCQGAQFILLFGIIRAVIINL